MITYTFVGQIHYSYTDQVIRCTSAQTNKKINDKHGRLGHCHSRVVGSDDVQYVLHSILFPEELAVILDDGRQVLDVTCAQAAEQT